jgi:hypothetical protein
LANIKNVKLGDLQVSKIYVGDKLNWIYEAPDVTAPTTWVYPDPTDPLLTHYEGQKVWLEVSEACNTYYTLDGSTPTTESTLFTEHFVLNETTTIKYFSVDMAGNVEPVKTTVFDIIGGIPTTTISPTNTVQNTIPITVTLSATNNPTAIYYKLGTGVQQTYTGPFTVTQDTAGVYSPQIKVTYWSVNAQGTEPQKIITYNTSGSVPSKPVVTVINGTNQVTLNWLPTENTTSYTVLRSGSLGNVGAVLLPSQYQKPTTYTDTTAVGGQTYYYTVQAGNYNDGTNSDQVIGLPTAQVQQTTYRYVRFQGFGDQTAVGTTRLVEFQAIGGGTNYLLNKLPISGEPVDYGGPISAVTDGSVNYGSGTYPLWWSGTGIPTLTYDLGADVVLDTMKVWMYTVSYDPRQTRFKLFASKDNIEWTLVKDHSANTVAQDATNGWSFPVPS